MFPARRFGIIVCAAATALFSQVNTASLTGLIKDPSEAAVANAKVTVTQKSTGVQRTATTDTSGSYFFPVLPVGIYDLTVESTGFTTANVSVTLETGQKGRQDFTLAVGSVETTVQVQSTVTQLSPQDASLGSVVDSNYVSRFPLLLRSWDDLLAMVPGVQGNRYPSQGGGTSFGRTGGFNVHGVRSLQNNFLLDGIDNNSISENVQELTSQVVRPSVDTIQEFKITTNPYAAEYGRSPGAAISVTTKGGTNQFHGTAYEYLRNRVLDANDFFSNRAGLAKPQNVQNQFGGNVGGPVVKDKLFFFFDYEGTRIRPRRFAHHHRSAAERTRRRVHNGRFRRCPRELPRALRPHHGPAVRGQHHPRGTHRSECPQAFRSFPGPQRSHISDQQFHTQRRPVRQHRPLQRPRRLAA